MVWFAAVLALSAPQQQCAATDVNLPAPLAGWTGLVPLRGKDGTSKAFSAGKPVQLSATVGQIVFTVDRPGAWGIALDQKGWIDLYPGASGGDPLASVRHGHGPVCSTIAKIVRFELQPGTYRVAVTRLSAPAARMMLIAPD